MIQNRKLRLMMAVAVVVAGASALAPRPAKADVAFSIGGPRGGVSVYSGRGYYDAPRYYAPPPRTFIYDAPPAYYIPRVRDGYGYYGGYRSYRPGYDYRRHHHHHHDCD